MRSLGTLLALVAFLFLLPWSPSADPLDAVAAELEAIVADLEVGQAQTRDLKARLEGMQALSEEHLATLQTQEALLADYRASVAALEEHDRASLELAKLWKSRWEDQRAFTGWLVGLSAVAVGVAVVEALWLVVR